MFCRKKTIKGQEQITVEDNLNESHKLDEDDVFYFEDDERTKCKRKEVSCHCRKCLFEKDSYFSMKTGERYGSETLFLTGGNPIIYEYDDKSLICSYICTNKGCIKFCAEYRDGFFVEPWKHNKKLDAVIVELFGDSTETAKKATLEWLINNAD